MLYRLAQANRSNQSVTTVSAFETGGCWVIWTSYSVNGKVSTFRKVSAFRLEHGVGRSPSFWRGACDTK